MFSLIGCIKEKYQTDVAHPPAHSVCSAIAQQKQSQNVFLNPQASDTTILSAGHAASVSYSNLVGNYVAWDKANFTRWASFTASNAAWGACTNITDLYYLCIAHC